MRTWGRSERPSPLSAFGHCQVSLGLRSSINGSTKDQNSVALFVMINVGPISTWTAENHEHNAEYTVLFLITGVCCFLRLRSPWWWERFSVDQPSTRKPCLPVPVCLSLSACPCLPVPVCPCLCVPDGESLGALWLHGWIMSVKLCSAFDFTGMLYVGIKSKVHQFIHFMSRR